MQAFADNVREAHIAAARSDRCLRRVDNAFPPTEGQQWYASAYLVRKLPITQR